MILIADNKRAEEKWSASEMRELEASPLASEEQLPSYDELSIHPPESDSEPELARGQQPPPPHSPSTSSGWNWSVPGFNITVTPTSESVAGLFDEPRNFDISGQQTRGRDATPRRTTMPPVEPLSDSEDECPNRRERHTRTSRQTPSPAGSPVMGLLFRVLSQYAGTQPTQSWQAPVELCRLDSGTATPRGQFNFYPSMDAQEVRNAAQELRNHLRAISNGQKKDMRSTFRAMRDQYRAAGRQQRREMRQQYRMLRRAARQKRRASEGSDSSDSSESSESSESESSESDSDGERRRVRHRQAAHRGSGPTRR